MKDEKKLNRSIHTAIEVSIRLGVLFLLIGWCLWLLYPFAEVVLWGIILAIAASPLFNRLNNRIGKPKWSAFLIMLFGLSLIILPSWLFLDSMVAGARDLMAGLDRESLSIPPPSDSVADWPLIGHKLHELWSLASGNLEDFLVKYQDQVTRIATVFAEGVLDAGGGVFQFILSGFLGLFTGAIVLSLGYKLFMAWLETDTRSG